MFFGYSLVVSANRLRVDTCPRAHTLLRPLANSLRAVRIDLPLFSSLVNNILLFSCRSIIITVSHNDFATSIQNNSDLDIYSIIIYFGLFTMVKYGSNVLSTLALLNVRYTHTFYTNYDIYNIIIIPSFVYNG